MSNEGVVKVHKVAVDPLNGTMTIDWQIGDSIERERFKKGPDQKMHVEAWKARFKQEATDYLTRLQEQRINEAVQGAGDASDLGQE